MKPVLLTGMSGTGKSSVTGELAALGYKAVVTDDGWCEPLPDGPLPDGRRRWRVRGEPGPLSFGKPPPRS